MAGDSALAPIQTAIYGVLTADATLIALLPAGAASIFDAQPVNGAAYPYVVIGDGQEQREDTFQSHGKGALLDISVWGIDAGTSGTSSKSGYAPLLTIARRICVLLDGTESTFAVTGYSVGEITHESTQTNRIKEDAVILRHVALDFRVYVHL